LASAKEHLLKIEYAAYKQIYRVLKSHKQKMQVGGILYSLTKAFQPVKHEISLKELHF
jgi:hypothetical protein